MNVSHYISASLRGLLLLGLLYIGILMTGCQTRSNSYDSRIEDYRMKKGDDIHWADPDFADSTWFRWDSLVPGKDTFWLRFDMGFRDTTALMYNQGVMVTGYGSYDCFWNGTYLGTNGKLASHGSEETVGKFREYFPLPTVIDPNEKNVIALRMTTTISDKFQIIAGTGNYIKIVTSPLRTSIYLALFAGIFLIISVYWLFLFLSDRKDINLLLFSITCFFFLGLIFFESLKLFYPYDYTFQPTRMRAIKNIHIVLSIITPFFFWHHFKLPKKWLALTVMILGALFITTFSTKGLDAMAIMHSKFLWSASFIIALVGVWKRIAGAYVILSAIAIGGVLIFFMTDIRSPDISHYDTTVFIGFALIVVSMLYSLILKRRANQKAYRESLLVSERLKNELLKKNIQPHFIKNTLTSLMEWVEEAPTDGAKFIHALSSEFDILNQMAEEKLVPIGQEIDLCITHLAVMHYRKDVNYIWKEAHVDYDEFIPPAIFHTLLENGITHARPNADSNLLFKLTYLKSAESKKYILSMAGIPRKAATTPVKEGTGIKYIKSRLKESYGDDWRLESKPTDDGWVTIIELL